MKPEQARRLAQDCLARGDVAAAAAAFEAGAHYFDAGTTFALAGDPARAFANLQRVTAGHPRYREACVRAIRLAPGRGPIGLSFENLLGPFLKTAPRDAEEAEALLALARLYEDEGFPENAAEALQRVLAFRPDHGEAAQALRRLSRPGAGEPPEPPGLPLLDRPRLDTPRTAWGEAAPAEANPFRVGATIAGRYRLEERIGAGGMSVVFRATDLQIQDEVAIKVFTQAVFDPETDARLRRELSLSRLLVHPNVVQLFSIGLAFGLRYVTLELLRGRDLGGRLAGGALPLDEGLDYLIQACAGLQAAHDLGIVHRDVKPENCFLTREGRLKLMDFGIAKVRDAAGLTATGMVAGTPAYMSPEQVLNFRAVTAAADQYSLGVVAYEMFTGTRPFAHAETVPLMMMHTAEPVPPPRQMNPALPAELERVILRCLEKDPGRRHASCRELMRELEILRHRA